MENEQDLFREIENVLHGYEDAYIPGAWEDFAKNKKRRRGLIYLRFGAAAAVLLLIGYIAWFFTPSAQINTTDHQTKNIKKTPYSYPNSNPHDSLPAGGAVASEKVTVPEPSSSNDVFLPAPHGLTAVNDYAITKKRSAETTKSNGARIASNIPGTGNTPLTDRVAEVLGSAKDDAAVANNNGLSNDRNTSSVVVADVPTVLTTEPKRYERGTQRLNYDSLANLNKPKRTIVAEKKDKNLSYTVLLSPSVGNQKMNFGTGVEVAYNINKSFSVSSGISYAYVNAGSNRSPLSADATPNYSLRGYDAFSSPQASSYSASATSQNVQGVKLALSGLEIPLNFQYKTAGGFYVSAGVSAMSVIGNNLSYNYINTRAVSSPSANGLAGNISIVTEQTTQKSNENLSGYIGFYTLSAGKKINFGRGKLNFAPFIKVPFNRVSSENIQLIHGGVQLGIGF